MVNTDFCGLDFGTSNSTIGIFNGSEIVMAPLEQGKPIIRSAIFFDYETNKRLYGQEGISEYLTGGHGRLMMSLKSILGSSLMQEKTVIDNKLVAFTDILGFLIRHLKQQAEITSGQALTRVVMGRPVRFHDQDDKKDKRAEDTLRSVAQKEGFETILFQYEPIAAALAYEQSITQEQLALIVDLGGGTSDFTVIRLRPGMENQDRLEDVLANKGIHIGGTDFDRLFSLQAVMPELGLGGQMLGMNGNDIPIPSSYFHDLTHWHTINSLYNHHTQRALQLILNHARDKPQIERLLHVIEKQQGHKILNEIEQGKCKLSNSSQVDLELSFIEANFLLSITKETFERIIEHKVQQLLETIAETIHDAEVENSAIDSIFFTGGSTQIPLIRHQITALFPGAKIVQGDVFSSVGKGLIIDAKRKFA